MLRTLLSNEEKHLIDRYRKAYCEEEGSNSFADCDYILREWANKKQRLYKLLGNQLIYSQEVCIKAPIDLLKKEMERLTDYDSFTRWYYDFVWEIAKGDYDLRESLRRIVSDSFLAKNCVDQDTVKVTLVNGKTISAPQGSKPMKFLAKIAEAYNKMEEFEQFRLEHSRVLNTKELKGTLCLSIHPLDFMTMSDNASGWSSCMSWEESGCYRRGTVEMMNSTNVLVAYLASKDNMSIPGGTWNNKKWRELFIVDDILTGVKGYPYQSDELVDMVLQIITDLAAKNINTEYEDETVKYIPFDEFLFKEQKHETIIRTQE